MKYNYLNLLWTVVLCCLLSPTLKGQTGSLYALDDGIVLQAHPDSVFARPNGNVFAYRQNVDGELSRVQSYINFDIAHLKGIQLESVNLSYRGKVNDDEYADEFGLELFSMRETFDAAENTTWNTRPNQWRQIATSTLNTSSARKDFISNGTRLLDYINDEIRKGNSTITFMIRSTGKDSTSNMWIGGMADGSFGPQLDYTITPNGSQYVYDDGVVLKGYPDSVFARPNNNLFAYKENVAGELQRVQSYIKFDIAHLKGKQLETVSLSYRGKVNQDEYADEFGLELFSMRENFNAVEDTTWNTRPTQWRQVATSTLNTSSARKDFISNGTRLLDYFNDEIRKGSDAITFMIRSAGKDSTSNMWIGGMGDGSFGPQLDYTVTPNGSQYVYDDGVVLKGYPDSVFARPNNNLFAYKENVDGELQRVQSYIKFDVAHLKGRQLETVSLSYRGKVNDAEYADDFGLELFSMRENFNAAEDTTWNTRPTQWRQVATSTLNTESARKDFISNGTRLLDYVNDELRKGSDAITFMIRSTGKDSTSNMWIGGMGDGSFGPQFDYTVSNAASSFAYDDGVVLQGYPDSVFARPNNNLFAYRQNVAGELQRVQSYVKFNIAHLKGTQVETVDFSYRGKVNQDEYADEFGIELFSMRENFDAAEDTTWNSRPNQWRQIATSILNTSSARKSFISNGTRLVDYVNDELRKGNDAITFMIRSTGKDSTSNMWIGGMGDGSFGPILDFGLPNIFTLENDTLTVIEDVFVSQAESDTNFEIEDADMHLIQDTTNMASKEIYLKFDISTAKAGIGVATLMLRGNQSAPPAPDLDFYLQVFGTDSDDWSEGVVTWNTKPATTTGALATYNITESKVHLVQGEDLTAYINDAINAGRQNITFVVKGRDETSFRAWISSKNWVPAQLALDYSAQEKSVLEDTYAAEGSPDENFNGITAMQIARDDAASNDRETYLKFDLDGARSNVVTTSLLVRGDQERGATPIDNFYIQVFGVDDNSWDETTLTWNNKPGSSDNVLVEYNVTESDTHELTSNALTDYIKEAIRQNKDQISFVVKGRDDTPGSNVWISDQGWRPAKLVLDYRQITSDPIFVTPVGDYIPDVMVEISGPTPGSSIYYTVDGSDPTDASTLYEGPIQLTDTTTIRAIAIAEGLANSEIVEATYNVAPVGPIEFTPNPQVEYQNSVTVTLAVEPADAFIFFSTDGGDPLTPYPSEGIFLDETTTIRARGISADGNSLGPISEAVYTVVTTVAGTGVGPGGVGASDNTIAGQPENPLWLKADAIEGASNGDEITLWEDLSGNGNDAYNTFVDGGENAIPNTGESQQNPPVFIEDGLNGHPILQFGASADATPNRGSLIIEDADNLDGGAGISVFMVLKRNQLLEGFASVFQKRNISGSNEDQSYVLEFNGGADPNKMQFVIQRELFLRNDLEINADDYYIINAELQQAFGDVIFRTNGVVEKVSSYNKIIPAVDAPVIIAGFQPMNVAEVILYRSGLNEAQNVIVHNYLAAKYDLTIGDNNAAKLYQNTGFISDMIGVGKTTYIDGTTEQEHKSASGGGLQMDTRSLLNTGDFVMAAHNGVEVTDAEQWERTWNIEVIGAAPNVTLSFNFAQVGLELPDNAADLKLYRHDGTDWSDLGLTATVNGDLVEFAVDGLQAGEYALGRANPATSTKEIDLSASLAVFPNPTKGDQISIELGNSVDGPLSIQMFDLMGRMVYQRMDTKAGFFYQENLSLVNVPKGIYTLKILQNGQYSSVKKVVRQ